MENIKEGGIAFFNDPLSGWAEVDKCYGFPCTAPLNALFYDKTGDLLKNTLGGFILPNNPGIAH